MARCGCGYGKNGVVLKRCAEHKGKRMAKGRKKVMRAKRAKVAKVIRAAKQKVCPCAVCQATLPPKMKRGRKPKPVVEPTPEPFSEPMPPEPEFGPAVDTQVAEVQPESPENDGLPEGAEVVPF
jgi:hypothetical protein